MKITYYLPTDEQHQAALCAVIRRLFQVEPGVVKRATGVKDLDWSQLDSLADLLHAEVVEAPFVTVTLDGAAPLDAEQQQLLSQATDTKREYDPEEVLRDLEE